MSKILSLAMLLGLSIAAAVVLAAAPTPDERRAGAAEAMKQGNWKDGYEAYRALALDPDTAGEKAGQDLKSAIACLQNLGRNDEVDDFRDAVVGAHKGDWRLLLAAGQSLADNEHYGFIVAGKFGRGGHRGGGRYVGSLARDRVRALQLLLKARDLARDDPDRAGVATLHLEFARILLFEAGGADQGWRLRRLTDLDGELPDYEENAAVAFGGRGRGMGFNPAGMGQQVGAPVDDEGNPVFFHLPESFEASRDDGERWRWMLAQAAELDHSRLNETRTIQARLYHQQFGVQTMAMGGVGIGPRADDGKENESGPYAVHTLGEDETIARLATGIKRFTLPDEFNFLKIYRQVDEGDKSPWGESAGNSLAGIFEDRRQYPKAVEVWRRTVDRYGPGPNNFRQLRLDQIVGNWGQFGNEATQPAGIEPDLEFRFRNGKKAHFEAREVLVSKLLDDAKAYLKSSPPAGQLDWPRMNLNNIGNRLIDANQVQFLGEKAATWDLDLDPKPEHFDRTISVKAPLKKPGAYLVTATMDGGNTARILVWVADTTIVKKPMDGGRALYFVADAVTGAPIAKANVEFFGFKQVMDDPTKPSWRIVTSDFAAFTDADGLVTPTAKDLDPQYQWVAIARTDGGRLAYLGFSGIWGGNYIPGTLDQVKVFLATDRPVYRPEQPVKFKFWVRRAVYQDVNEAEYADKPFRVKINNPKGETIFQKDFTSDKFGGFDGEYAIPKDGTLGQYQLFLDNLGGGAFRVEEYKKPEFEVSVDAPSGPVRLGEKIEATVRAKYYFGAPVSEAKVSYKVTRSSYQQSWFPKGRWDWLYGAGYGWFARDYSWYPGWSSWGPPVMRHPWWMPFQAQPPEVIAQDEVSIGPDGTVKIAIDTGPAKAMHGDSDHKYEITAEVVDASRRTIVGSGSVLVARKAFQVSAWLDRGYYRAGQDIHANFQAQTLDGKPVKGKGKLTLLGVHYKGDARPTEEVVKTWDLDTDDQGQAHLQLKAAEEGQFRLSYVVKEPKTGESIEGGYVFVVRGDGFDGKSFRFNDVELVADKREYAPGDKVRLMVNVNKISGTVLLFVRPVNGVVLAPRVLRIDGKSTVQEIEVAKGDMPNFFVEALTISDGKVHSETLEVIVPPEQRVLNVEVLPSRSSYKPGAPAKVKVKLTDIAGKPFLGSVALTMYDKSLEYISGGSNVPEIRAFFWKWRRQHAAQNETNLAWMSGNLMRPGEAWMQDLGIFGNDALWGLQSRNGAAKASMGGMGGGRRQASMLAAAPAAARGMLRADKAMAKRDGAFDGPAADGLEADRKAVGGNAGDDGGGDDETGMVQPTLRKIFADSAAWAPALTTTAADGTAEVGLTMPENLTGWKVRAWGMGAGTQVGQGEAEVVTTKDLLLRMQAPRFFVQKDEVVLSANIHNYLKVDKKVKAILELDGKVLAPMEALQRNLTVKAGGEARVDWRPRREP